MRGLTVLVEYWRASRIGHARQRLDNLLDTTPRFWIAGRVGGGAMLTLGRVTRKQAVAQLTAQNRVVTYVDRDAAFIAYEASAENVEAS